MADVQLCRTSLYLGSPSPSPSSSWSSCSSLLSTPWLQCFKVERVSVSYSLHSDTTSGKSFWEPNRELITHNMQIGKCVFFIYFGDQKSPKFDITTLKCEIWLSAASSWLQHSAKTKFAIAPQQTTIVMIPISFVSLAKWGMLSHKSTRIFPKFVPPNINLLQSKKKGWKFATPRMHC